MGLCHALRDMCFNSTSADQLLHLFRCYCGRVRNIDRADTMLQYFTGIVLLYRSNFYHYRLVYGNLI